MYYVNEDIPLNSARVHNASVCSFAQERDKNPDYGKWHGPFTSLDEARRCAHQTRRKIVSDCQVCIRKVYYVNEDIPLNSAKVHNASVCYYAQERNKKPAYGKWHGPFTSLDDARGCARQTRRKTVSDCQVCIKRVYYVNEDIPLNSARVHDASACYYAQEREKKPGDGQWYGPFSSLDDARKCAYQTGRKTVSDCQLCIK